MTPVQLYADILLDDEVMNGRPAETTKEASLAARISDGKGGKGGKRGRRGRNKGRQQHRAPQPFDGYVYDGRRPSEEYVRSQKEKRGQATVNANSAPGLATWLTTATNSRLSRLNKDRSRILRVRNRLTKAQPHRHRHPESLLRGRHPSPNSSPAQPK